jgi:2-alkyl-3-oxoalkanoate reductase
MAYYPQTKAMAEREVLAANGQNGLYTISLRPHLIFGPGDERFVPTILKRARAGRLVQIGNGENLVDFTYIDDCVQAHLRALLALDENPYARGKAYFISQGNPVKLWWWIGEVLKRNKAPEIKRRISKNVATVIAGGLELACRALPSYPEPRLTRFLVSEMATHHYFNITRAREELGYQPTCSVKEALARTFGAE